MAIFDKSLCGGYHLSACLPSLISAITRNHRNDTWQQPIKDHLTHEFGSNLNFKKKCQPNLESALNSNHENEFFGQSIKITDSHEF